MHAQTVSLTQLRQCGTTLPALMFAMGHLRHSVTAGRNPLLSWDPMQHITRIAKGGHAAGLLQRASSFRFQTAGAEN
jgi:hypothetical protein